MVQCWNLNTIKTLSTRESETGSRLACVMTAPLVGDTVVTVPVTAVVLGSEVDEMGSVACVVPEGSRILGSGGPKQVGVSAKVSSEQLKYGGQSYPFDTSTDSHRDCTYSQRFRQGLNKTFDPGLGTSKHAGT